MQHAKVVRRRFLQVCAAVAAWAGARLGSAATAAQTQFDRSRVKTRKPYIAIQVPPFCFVDEGTEKVLDIVQARAHVNTIWAYTFTYEHYRLRRSQSIPLPDHGVWEFEPDYTGGAFFDYDRKYFGNTILDDFRAPDYKGINIITEVTPKAKARGMDVVAWEYMDFSPRRQVNASKIMEVDVYGRRANSACFNNEDFRNHLFGKIENYLKKYPELAGIAEGCERQGPLMNMIGGGWTVPHISCFCSFCQAKARERGISVERAQRGYREMDRFFQAARGDQRPTDGYFVGFWRLLLEYPEILAWEKLWTDSYHEVRAQIYGIGKAIAPEKPLGWHIMHQMTLSPFYRAEEDYAETKRYADFVKPAVYNNSGGPRMAEFLNRLHATIFHDARPEDFLPLYYKIMNYEKEVPHDKLPTAGLSSDYVYRETKRAVSGVNGEIPVYPGIDIDIPTQKGHKHTTPDDARQAVKAAFAAGAQGVVFSRRYSEMQLANLAGAGQGLREAGVI